MSFLKIYVGLFLSQVSVYKKTKKTCSIFCSSERLVSRSFFNIFKIIFSFTESTITFDLSIFWKFKMVDFGKYWRNYSLYDVIIVSYETLHTIMAHCYSLNNLGNTTDREHFHKHTDKQHQHQQQQQNKTKTKIRLSCMHGYKCPINIQSYYLLLSLC